MKKFYILLIFIFLSLLTFAERIEIPIDEENSFDANISKYNENYFYHIKKSYPVIPSLKFKKVFENDIDIDSIYLVKEKIIKIKVSNILVGENPLPKEFEKSEKSKLEKIKGKFPIEDYKVFKTYYKGKTILSGYVCDYFYQNGEVFKITGKLVIEYRKNDKNLIKENKGIKKFLIITDDSLKSFWDDYVDLNKTYSFDIKGVNEIYSIYPSITKPQAIREYIKSLYESGSLEGVLLGGDVSVVPPFYVQLIITPQLSSSEQTIPTDKFFACLDGNPNFVNDTFFDDGSDIDIGMDILLGRVPVKNRNDILNFIQKVKNFENITNDTILLAASYLDVNTDGSQNCENMIRNIPIYNPTIKLYERYDNLSSFSFIENINKSPFLVSHDGHGNYSVIQTGIDYTTRENFDTLKNSKPILFYSISCFSAAYDYDCVAEHFILSPNGGGYYIGNSRYGWYTPYFSGFGTGDIYNYTFFKKFFNESNNPSEVLSKTFLEFVEEIKLKNDWRWQFFTLNYFGDPLLNLKVNKENSSIKFIQPIYKNGYLNFSVKVLDSCLVKIEGNTFSIDTVLYKDKNIFCCRIDNSDSIKILIRINESLTLDTFVLPLNATQKSVYISDYNFTLFQDTLFLNLSLKTDSNGFYNIKANGILDTLLLIESDTVFYIENDTTISFKFIRQKGLDDLSSIPLDLNGNSIYLQYGKNISKNLNVKIFPEKQHYDYGDLVKLNITAENLLFDTLHLLFNSKSYPLIKGLNIISDSFVLTNFGSIESLKVEVVSNLEKSDLIYGLNINGNTSFQNFENSPTLKVDSSTAFFHLSTRRSLSGYYSLFSGYKTSETYPPNYLTSFYSDTFIFDTTYIFGFSAFVDIEPGMDYFVVRILSDSFKVPIITLSDRLTDFKSYIFNASDYRMLQGKKSLLQFSFYSENDNVQYKGVYIDDLVLPGILVENSGFYLKGIDSPKRFEVYYKNGSILIESPFDEYTLKIYDISGKLIFKNELRENRNTIKFNSPSGIYFIKVESKGEIFKEKIFILK